MRAVSQMAGGRFRVWMPLSHKYITRLSKEKKKQTHIQLPDAWPQSLIFVLGQLKS